MFCVEGLVGAAVSFPAQKQLQTMLQRYRTCRKSPKNGLKSIPTLNSSPWWSVGVPIFLWVVSTPRCSLLCSFIVRALHPVTKETLRAQLIRRNVCLLEP